MLNSFSSTGAPYNPLSLSFLALLGFIGFCFNVALYFDDINNRGGVLNNVAKKRDELQEHMESSKIEVKGEQTGMFVGETAFTDETPASDPNKLSAIVSNPDALKRSMARASLAT